MQERQRHARFKPERFFYILGDGWYFEAREGMFGPHESRASAQLALLRLITRFPHKRGRSHTGRVASQQRGARARRSG